MSPRDQRAAIARETLAIVESGRYSDPSGRVVDVSGDVRACVAATRLVLPGEWVAFERPHVPESPSGPGFGVRNESTLKALARRVAAGHRRVGVLNFASARRPGGGFQSGAEAQEEALARSSALYASLVSESGSRFYRHGAALDGLYTDRVVVSPDCPVFRDASGALLPAVLPATFLTCAAPNATALRANEPRLIARLPQAFHCRIERVLDVAVMAGCDALVLGAWGCGVFGNDPDMVAAAFARHLTGVGAYAGCFKHVDFAVLDSSQGLERLRAFERVFGATPV